MQVTVDVTGSVTLINNSVSNVYISDDCENSGGGASLIFCYATVSGEITFINNSAEGKSSCGGGLFLNGSRVAIAESGTLEFTNNHVGSMGGGFGMQDGNLSVNGTVSLTANSAGSFGGGLSINSGSVYINGNVSATNNFANRGGGSDMEGGILHVSGAMSFIGNSANLLGGGFFMVNIDTDIEGCVFFADNHVISSSDSQGAGWSMHYSTANVTGMMSFVNNSANLQGGGFAVISSSLSEMCLSSITQRRCLPEEFLLLEVILP